MPLGGGSLCERSRKPDVRRYLCSSGGRCRSPGRGCVCSHGRSWCCRRGFVHKAAVVIGIGEPGEYLLRHRLGGTMAGAELTDKESARRKGRLFPRASVACIDVGSSRLLIDKAAFRIALALKTRVRMGRAEAGTALAGPQVGSEANDRIDSRLPPGSRREECGRVAHRCPIIGAKPVINISHDCRGELGAHVKAAAAPRGGAPYRLWAMPRDPPAESDWAGFHPRPCGPDGSSRCEGTRKDG